MSASLGLEHGGEDGQQTIFSIQAAVHSLEPEDSGRVRELAGLLDKVATLLARSEHTRQNIGNATNPCIWPILARLWNTSSLQTLSHKDSDHPAFRDALTIAVAKFTRNLVAANPVNQQRAFDNEPAIRNLIYHYTSYNATQDASTYPITRVLAQTLSNMVTNNDQLAQKLWLTYLNIPEEQSILTRLFASPDPLTLSSAFVLVINCVHDSVRRTQLLVESPRGPRICLAMLDRVASLIEAEAESESGSAFDFGYAVFSRIFDADLAGTLYTRLAVEGEPITPHQTTLLKLLDSYLHSSSNANGLVSPREPSAAHGGHLLLHTLTHIFLDFSAYTRNSLRRALGSQPVTSAAAAAANVIPQGGTDTEPDETSMPRVTARSQASGIAPLRELDLLLPKVCEALVLTTQCLTTLALRAEEPGRNRPTMPSSTDPDEKSLPLSLKTLVVAASSSSFPGQSLVECLVETLRLVDEFVPRITYGKLVRRPPMAVGQGQGRPAEEEASTSGPDGTHSVAGGARHEGEGGGGGDTSPDPQAAAVLAAEAFAHVKRDLVRLLGILVADDRAAQDRARECGGIPVVMNLCVVDDYNPYLREHAIFALRNLLHGNPDNQAIVDAIKPVGRWDQDKVLRSFGADDGS